MFGNKDGKPVDLEITESTYIEGKLVEKGEKLKSVPAELALELVGAGRARALKAGSKAAAKAEG